MIKRSEKVSPVRDFSTRGEMTEARKIIRDKIAMTKMPSDCVKLWSLVARTYREVDNYKEAINIFEEALQAHPEFFKQNLEVWKQWDHLYVLHRSDAIARYRQAIRLGEGPYWGLLSGTYDYMDQREQAIEVLEEACDKLQSYPELSGEYWVKIGIRRRDMGDRRGAIRAFKRAAETDMQNPDRWYTLACHYDTYGQ
jgi:tetratricopeptide (TPR) repeat protein